MQEDDDDDDDNDEIKMKGRIGVGYYKPFCFQKQSS